MLPCEDCIKKNRPKICVTNGVLACPDYTKGLKVLQASELRRSGFKSATVGVSADMIRKIQTDLKLNQKAAHQHVSIPDRKRRFRVFKRFLECEPLKSITNRLGLAVSQSNKIVCQYITDLGRVKKPQFPTSALQKIQQAPVDFKETLVKLSPR